jgi:hypothetical protein
MITTPKPTFWAEVLAVCAFVVAIVIVFVTFGA